MRLVRKPSLGLILILGLLHGLLYVFLVPPWQHYDEPAHFEYAWLIANRPGLPLSGEFDQPLRRALAASMIEHDFFRGMGVLSDLDASNEAVWIGVSQVGDPPLYYLLASLPLRFLSTWDVTLQLYAARFVSLGLYLLSILCAWGMLQELVSDDHILRWMVPLSMALLPGFTDLMTSVNNDVGAVVLFCLFLWGSLRLIRRGFSLPGLLWVGAAALLSLWTKETVILALPLLGLVLLLVLFRDRWRWVPWAVLVALALVIPLSVFSWGETLFWSRLSTRTEIPIRVHSEQAPLGDYIIQIENYPDQIQEQIYQTLPSNQINSLQGRLVTLGGWVWATEPLNIYPITYFDGRQSYSQAFNVDQTPIFIAMTITLSEDADRARVMLSPGVRVNQGEWTVFYDGLVMVDGAYPLDQIPQFDDSSARQGMWGGQSFRNLISNASAESDGPGLRPWARDLSVKLFHALPDPALAVSAIFDWRGSSWYYRAAGQNLLHTFWAKFGWGHVSLLPLTNQFYFLLQMITLFGLSGVYLGLFRRRSSLTWSVILFMGIVLVGIWVQTFFRGIESIRSTIFIPVARYAYPVIIPTLLMLNAGWLEIAYLLERWVHLSPRVKLWVYALFFLGLDLASVYSVAYYYYIR